MASSSGNSSTTTSSGSGGTGSPCGACKFLRRKCAADCIFAPYFCSEQGPTRFAAIHKVFGASNVSKLLLHLPAADRCEAVVTIAFEAQARLRDPVHGCVSHIFSLQHQVAYLQAQLMQLKSQMAAAHNGNYGPATPYSYNFNPSPQGSPESVDYGGGGGGTADHLLQEMLIRCREEASMLDLQKNYSSSSYAQSTNTKKRPYDTTVELGDLQALAFRMMGSYN
ncbi:LOB domain-containing protein 16 [Linum grandiflorum]